MRAFDGHSGGAGSSSGGGGGSQRAIALPDAVGDTAAGAELAALLDGIPVERVSGYATVTYMKAAYRLATHYQGLFLKALLETGLRMPSSDDYVVRTDTPGDFAAEEARAALVWSRSRAEGAFGRAYEMFGQHPAVGDALLDAKLDEPRAKAFCSWTAGLAYEHAKRIIDELLPVAPKLTVSELIDRIKRMAIALDPEWAERRYRESVRERRVELRQTPEGTADLAGRDLPADRAKIGSDRINQLALACKTAGDKRCIDTIRADLFLGMLDGQFTGMSDRKIVDHVLAHPVADDPIDNNDEGDDNGNDDLPGGNTGGGNNPGGPAGRSPDSDDSDNEDDGNSDRDGDGEPGGSDFTGPGDDSPYGPARSDCTGGPQPPLPDRPDHEEDAGASPAWNVRELRTELSTVLGMDEHPAELPGLGYLPAVVARSLVARMTSAEWRFVICTRNGTPICSGITTHRPSGRQRALRDNTRGGVLELQLTSTHLFELSTAIAHGEHADWADVIIDIANRYRQGILDTDAIAGTRSADSDAAATGGDHPDRTASAVAQAVADVRRRRARAGLRRWVEVRDRYCLHPACRMPAGQADQDHRMDYADGGPTVAANLDSHCRHDHRLQHDGGWRVTRPAGSDPLTGSIVWTSPLGHRYESRPPPVMQPYPEPGSHYPGEVGLPSWFTALVESAKAARQGSAETASAGAEPDDTARPRPTVTDYPAEPPF